MTFTFWVESKYSPIIDEILERYPSKESEHKSSPSNDTNLTKLEGNAYFGGKVLGCLSGKLVIARASIFIPNLKKEEFDKLTPKEKEDNNIPYLRIRKQKYFIKPITIVRGHSENFNRHTRAYNSEIQTDDGESFMSRAFRAYHELDFPALTVRGRDKSLEAELERLLVYTSNLKQDELDLLERTGGLVQA